MTHLCVRLPGLLGAPECRDDTGREEGDGSSQGRGPRTSEAHKTGPKEEKFWVERGT